MKKSAAFLVSLAMLFFAPGAEAMELLMHGADAQSSGGLGITTSSGPSSLLYNPAGLGKSSAPRVLAETGFLSLNYSYTYPEFDPANISVNTPFLLLGTTWSPVSWLTLGAVLFPIPATGKPLQITNVPSRQLSSSPSLIDVETKNLGPLDYTASTGLSLFNSRFLSLGVSWTQKKSEVMTAVSDSETGSEIFAFESRTIADTGLLGLNIRPFRKLQISLTYQTLTRITADGTFLNENGESFSRRAHTGREFGGGLKAKFSPVTIWAEGLYRQHSEGTGNLSPFATTGTVSNEPEYFDALSFAGGLEWGLGGGRSICGGYGWHPSTTGAGLMAEDPAEEIPGFQFGDMDAISRHVAGAGYQSKSKTMTLKFAGSYQTGYRFVSLESREAGEYRLNVYTLTGSVSTSF